MARWAGTSAFARPLLAVVLILLCAAPSLGFLSKRWTYDLESEFLRHHLGQVADGCVIVRHTPSVFDRGLEASPYLSRGAGRRHSWITTNDLLAQGELRPCTVFYESASCHASNPGQGDPGTGSSECGAIRARFSLEPIATAQLPAQGYVGEAFRRVPVPVGLYGLAAR